MPIHLPCNSRDSCKEERDKKELDKCGYYQLLHLGPATAACKAACMLYRPRLGGDGMSQPGVEPGPLSHSLMHALQFFFLLLEYNFNVRED